MLYGPITVHLSIFISFFALLAFDYLFLTTDSSLLPYLLIFHFFVLFTHCSLLSFIILLLILSCRLLTPIFSLFTDNSSLFIFIYSLLTTYYYLLALHCFAPIVLFFPFITRSYFSALYSCLISLLIPFIIYVIPVTAHSALISLLFSLLTHCCSLPLLTT